ncbi:MAG: phosphatase PAP2 family protein [Candidatus Berkiella sp.]
MTECTPSLLQSGIPTIDWIATHLRIDWLTPVVKAISDLGQEGTIIFTIALAYWLWNKRYTTYLGYAMFCAFLVNVWIKGWVMECRPPMQYWLEMIPNGSYSFPSGHTQVATPLWFGFAYYVRNKWLSFGFFMIGLLIALSRPYLGVHFVHDVAVGAILGITIYGLFILAETKNWQPLQKLSIFWQLAIIAGLIGLYFLTANQVSSSAIKGFSALVGFWAGCQCEARWAHYLPPQTLIGRIGVLSIGCVGILLFWKGLSFLGTSIALKSIQYALLGWWITFGLPFVVHLTKMKGRVSSI